jgi:hypothetical protein
MFTTCVSQEFMKSLEGGHIWHCQGGFGGWGGPDLGQEYLLVSSLMLAAAGQLAEAPTCELFKCFGFLICLSPK